MSNAYTHINNYSDVLFDTPAFELIQAGMQYKQQKYDAGKAKLDTLMSKIDSIDLAKSQDKEYLQKRLQATLDIANKYASGDLSDDNLVNSLKMTVGQVADDNVMNAVASTKLMRAEQKEWEDARKKADGKYSDVNRSWASQNAQKWLSDGQVGSTYGGGGGFVEYSDYKKKLIEALPKQIELIKRKAYQNVDDPNTEIDAVNVLEIVDRYKLNGVVDTILDSKDRMQMKIDSWSTYGKMSDDALKAQWEDYRNPKIKERADEIESIETLLKNGNLDENTKALYKTSLEDRKREKQDLEDNTFEAALKNDGRDGVSYAMFATNFKNTVLDTYSGTSVVDQKVNEIQKANADLAIKYAHLKLAESAEKRAIEKASKEATATGSGFTTGKKEIIDTTKDEKTSVLNKEMAAQVGVRNTLVKDLQGKLPNVNIEQFLSSKEFTVLAKSNLTGKQTITIAGKEIRLTPALRVHIDKFRDAFIDNPVKKDAFEDMDNALKSMRAQVAVGLKTGNTEAYNIPNMNLRYKKLENGTYTLEKMPYKEGQNRYAYLLKVEQGMVNDANGKKVVLTEAGKKDLKLYSALQQMHDGNLDGYQRQLAKEYVINIAQDLDKKGFDKINLKENLKNSNGVMPNTYSKVTGQDLWFSEYGKGDISGNFGGRTVKGIMGTTMGIATGLVQNVVGNFSEAADKKLGDLADSYYGVGKYEDTARGTDKIQKDLFKRVQDGLDRHYSEEYNIGSNTSHVLTKKGNEDQYNGILKRMGITTSSTGDLVVTKKVVDGLPIEGKLIVKVLQKEGAKAKDATAINNGIEIDESEIKAFLEFDTKRYRYSLESRYPKSLNLGNGYYDGMETKGLDKKYVVSLIQNIAQEEGNINVAQKVAEDYRQGKYEVRLVGDQNKGTYGYRVYYTDTDKQPNPEYFSAIPNTTNLPDETVMEIQENPKEVVDSVISDYITYKASR